MVLSANAAFTERHKVESVTIANPAAGDSILFTVPDNTVIQVVGVRFLFETDANAADRRIGVYAYQDVGTGIVQASFATITQAASLTYLYYFSCGVVPFDGSGDTNPFACFPLACGIQLQAGEQLRIIANEMQVADTFTSIAVRSYEWKED